MKQLTQSLFFVLIAILSLEVLSAQTEKIVENEPGRLKEILGEEYNVIEDLIVKGKINDADILAMNSMPELKTLNLKDAVIVNSKGDITTKFPNYKMSETKKLEKIVLPENLTVIGSSSFLKCKKLKEVVLGPSVSEIWKKAFMSCDNLSAINFPSSLHYLSESSFYGTKSLHNIDFASIDTISKMAFYNGGLIDVKLSKKTKSIGEAAFSSIPGMQSFSVDDNNQYYTIKDGMLLTKDLAYMLLYMPFIQNEVVNIPSYVSKIGMSAMEHNPSVKELHILGNVEVIPNSVCRMTPIEKVYLPKSVNEIEVGAFDETSKTIKEVHFRSEKCPKIDETSFGFMTKPTSLVAYVPKGSYDDYDYNEVANKIFYKIIEEDEPMASIVRLHTEASVGETITVSFEPADGAEISFEGIEKPSYGIAKVISQDITVKGDVKSIDISDANINKIELVQPKLETLICPNNKIPELDVSGSPELKILTCNDNQIGTIDISNNNKLEELDLSGNNLKELDTKSCPELKYLLVHNNSIETANTEFNIKLLGVDFSKNNLTNLNLTKNTNLEIVYCYLNNLSKTESLALSESLADRSKLEKAGKLFIIETTDKKERNQVYTDAVNEAKSKNWIVLDYKNGINDGAGEEYPGKIIEGVNRIDDTKFEAFTNGNTLTIENAVPNKEIFVYSINGQVVKKQVADELGKGKIQLDPNQVYIIRSGKHILRVVL